MDTSSAEPLICLEIWQAPGETLSTGLSGAQVRALCPRAILNTAIVSVAHKSAADTDVRATNGNAQG